MPEKETTLRRIVARVRCMLPRDWLGRAGKRFRQTTTAISDFSEQHIRLGEKVEAAPDLAWRALEGAASEKYARALRDYAEEEKDKLDSELKRRTLESNARQAKAAADKLESEVRTAQINEMDARLAFFDKLRERNAVPIWDDSGNMTFAKVPKDYDWDGLQDRMLRTSELPKLGERSDAPIKETGTA
jgi:hypothetical protein